MKPSAPIPVLLVDDHPANLVALRAVLESPRYELVTATSGAEAIREASAREFAVVLLDVRMPAMDGYETALHLRALGARRPVPIIFVTANDGPPSEVERAYAESGVVDFVQKPFVAGVIRAKVSVFGELYAARQEAARALHTLTDLTLAFATTTTVADVAGVILDEGMRVARGDACSLYVLDEEHGELSLLGHRGAPPGAAGPLRRISESNAPGSFALLRSRASAFAQTSAEHERMNPPLSRAEEPAQRARASWSAPLVAEGRAVGLLAMGFLEEQRFEPEDRALVDTLAKQCGQALLRAIRLELEESARGHVATIIRSIGDAVIATDVAGRVTIMNAGAERLTGWAETEARGRRFDEVFHLLSEATRAPCESPVARVLREGRAFGLAGPTVLRSKAGRETPIDDSVAPIRDRAGALLGVVLVFRDVSDEKRLQVRTDFLARAGEALASSLAYRTTLATVARLAVPQLADWCAVDLLEPGERVPQQVAIAHADPEKVELARELRERYPAEPGARRGPPEVIRSGKPELYSELPPSLVETLAKDPEHLRLLRELRLESAMIVPLRGRDRTLGAITFIYAGSGRRFTDQDLSFAEDFARRAAMAIERAQAFKDMETAQAEERLFRREADTANHAKDELLAVVSHELRTPLHAILGWTSALTVRKLPPEIERAVGAIERNAHRQARLVDDLLDVSRIIGGKLTLRLAPTNVAEAVGGALESVTPAAEAKQIALCCDADPSVTIQADADRLQQIVWNLLANAVKFTPKGGEVSVRAYREGSEVRILVADNGEGIPPEALPYVFEPFRQADASLTRRHGGLGLGLAIVKQLVAAHGGTIRVSSDGAGRGTTFVVALPARAAVPTLDKALPAPETPAPRKRGGSEAAPPLDGLSILIVDDEADVREVVAEVLSQSGATVTAAASAQEALQALPAAKPDVIVSDIGMPEMDGYDFMRHVRKLPADDGSRTPALALTAYARQEDVLRAHAAGFQLHAAKPVEPSRLVTMIASLAGLFTGS